MRVTDKACSFGPFGTTTNLGPMLASGESADILVMIRIVRHLQSPRCPDRARNMCFFDPFFDVNTMIFFCIFCCIFELLSMRANMSKLFLPPLTLVVTACCIPVATVVIPPDCIRISLPVPYDPDDEDEWMGSSSSPQSQPAPTARLTPAGVPSCSRPIMGRVGILGLGSDPSSICTN
ncbi:hypothetical protein B0T10DRAFT_309024 [Thelonectria olida]|uniref:Uncharacterized protein n=1 Tax=Thelonectria olida TaxID=1576542 RepID=A0A9P8W8X2_9HYPO|nr:hypothetical protein B0T10DRAFT_309024 [Thelonectria olida]